MVKNIFLIIFCSHFVLGSWVQAEEADMNCEFYAEQAKKMGCESTHFLFAFAKTHCEKIQAALPQFSNYGKIFLPAIQQCLIEKIDQHQEATCADIAKYTFQTFASCAVEQGYCKMPLSDKLRLSSVFRKDLYRPRLWTTAFRMDYRCLRRPLMSH